MTAMAEAHPDPTALGRAPRQIPGLRTTFRESFQYAVGGLAYKAVALVSVPVLARLLVPADLGLLDLAVLIALVVYFTASAGLENALARLDAAGTEPGVLWGSAGATLVGGVVLVGACGLLLASWISRVVTGSDSNADIIVAGVAYGSVLAFSLTAQNAVRIRRRPKRYATYGFAIAVGEMAAALSLAVAGASVAVIVLGWAGASLVGAMVLIIREVPRPSKPSTHVIRRLLTYGVPLVPATLVWIIGDLGVRGVLAHEAGASSLGLFGLATRLTSPVQLLVVGFGLAWHPFIYAAAPGRMRELAKGAAARLVAVLGVASITLTVLAPEIVAVVAGSGYDRAVGVVPGLSAGMVLFGLITLATAVLGTGYRLGPVVLASLGGAILQIGLSWWLIPIFGFGVSGVTVALGYGLTATYLAISAGVLTRSLGGQLATAFSGLLAANVALELNLPTRLAVGVAASTVVVMTWLFFTWAAREREVSN